MEKLDNILALIKNDKTDLTKVYAAIQSIESLVAAEKVSEQGRYEGFMGFLRKLLDWLRQLFGAKRERVQTKAVSELVTFFNRPVATFVEPNVDLRFTLQEKHKLINIEITRFLLAQGDKSTLKAAVNYLTESYVEGSSDQVLAALGMKILRIDDPSILATLFAALDNPAKAIYAARSLNYFYLPDPPVHQPIKIPALFTSLDLQFSSLKEEIELVRDRSNGLIVVDADVWPEITRIEKTFVRGNVNYPNWTLELILRTELNYFELEYYIENGKVTICTLVTAAQRWKVWWKANQGRLKFNSVEKKYTF